MRRICPPPSAASVTCLCAPTAPARTTSNLRLISTHASIVIVKRARVVENRVFPRHVRLAAENGGFTSSRERVAEDSSRHSEMRVVMGIDTAALMRGRASSKRAP